MVILRTIITLLFLSSPAWAGTNYYVDADCATPGTGTASVCDGGADDPWDSLDDVAGATSGDTVYFDSADTWTGATTPVLIAEEGVTYIGDSYGTGTRAIITASDMTASRAVVLLNYDDITFQGFEVNANNLNTGGIYVGSKLLSASVSGIIVDNCVVHDIGSGQVNEWSHGILIGPSFTDSNIITVSNVTIKNTTVYNTCVEALAVYPSSYDAKKTVDGVLIQGCEVYNSGEWQYGVGVHIKNASDNVIVEKCLLHDNPIAGLYFETPSDSVTGSPNGAIIRYNKIYENDAAGIYFNDVKKLLITAVIYGNLIYNNGNAGTASGFDIYFGAYDMGNSVLEFYNNTIYNTENAATNKYCILVGSNASTPPTNVTINFKNNIVFTDEFIPIIDPGNVLTHNNNLIYRSSGVNDTYVTSGVTNYNAAAVKSTWEIPSPDYDNNVDPSFTTPGSDFTLSSGASDAVGNGAVLTGYDNALLSTSVWPSAVETGDQDNYNDGKDGWEIGAYLWGPLDATANRKLQGVSSCSGCTLQ